MRGCVMAEKTDPQDALGEDRNGVQIKDGDWVSLDGNMTADDSMGYLPNGFMFEESDVYRVIWDERMPVPTWGLDIPGVEPDTPYNCKYLSHAVGLLHDGDVTIVEAPK
mgnify:CR=1 FL=1